jgi:hypothetical protein
MTYMGGSLGVVEMVGLKITLGQVEYGARPFDIGGSLGVVEMFG